jgi:DNA-binding MarR family transcriptional regulator
MNMIKQGEGLAHGLPEGMDLDGLDKILGLHVSLANVIILQHFNRSFIDIGLTPKQTATLWLAAANPGIPQVDIARFFRMDRATMLGITNSLTEQGLLDRGPSIRNGRTIGLHITPAGAERLASAKAAVARHEQWVKSALAPEEVDQLFNLLAKLNRPREAELTDGETATLELLG